MQFAKPKKGYKLAKWYYGKNIEIPEEWDMSTIGKIGKYINGFAFKPSDWKRQGVPIIRIQNLTNESQSFNYYDKSFDKIYEINKDDLLISWSASLDIFKWDRQRAVLNQHIFKAIPNKNIDRIFFYFAVSERIQDMKKMIHGSTMQHITKKPFLDTLLPLPSLPEQKQIASILSNVDDTLQKTNQIIEQTQRLKKGMMQKLLTRGIGHTKFKKVKWMFGKEIEIPEEWEIEKMNDLCVKITDGTHHTPKYVSKGKLFLSVLNVRPNRIRLDKVKYISPDEHSFLIKRAKPELLDILYTKIGTYGLAAVVENISDFSIFVSLALLKPKKDLINPYFLCELMNSYFIKRQADVTVKGIGVPDLHLIEIKKFNVLLPSLPEQKQISSILSNVDTQIQKEKLHKSNLERLKKGLMQKLLTGQIRVKIK